MLRGCWVGFFCLVTPAVGVAQTSPRYRTVRPATCDAAPLTPRDRPQVLTQEIGGPDSVTQLSSPTRMRGGGAWLQYVAGHVAYTTSGTHRGVQAHLLLYASGRQHRNGDERTLVLLVNDSLRLQLGEVTLTEHEQQVDRERIITQQMTAPLTPAQFTTLASANRVDGKLGRMAFQLSPDELGGLKALYAAVVCGVDNP